MSKQSVLRHVGGQSLGGIVAGAALTDTLTHAELHVELNAMRAAALRPVLDVIQADVTAVTAADRFRRVNQELRQRLSQQLDNPGAMPPITITFGPGTTVHVPPYDHPQVGPDTGVDEGHSSADVLAGSLHIDAVPGNDFDGVFFAIAGLSIDVEASSDGTLEIRPFAQSSFAGVAYGSWLDSSVEGHLTTRVLDVATQTQVASPTDYRLFAQQSNGTLNDSITLGGGSLAVGFPARAGGTYQVWITASVSGNQSGNSRTYAGSVAAGMIDASVPFVVAELH